MEKEKQKPAADPRLLTLRCSRALLFLSSLRQPPQSTTRMTTHRSSSSSMEFELRNARLLDAELAAARREADVDARISTAELVLVIALVPLLLLLLFIGLLAGAAAEAFSLLAL